MKTQIIISKKAVSTALLAIALLTAVACSNEQGKSGRTNKQSSVTRTNPKPPGTDIHTAALTGNLKAVQQHIAAGTDLNEKDPYGSTPLIIAATFGKTEVARALIDAGADVNIPNNERSTPLHIAAFFCRPEIVKMLLENGADKNLRNNYGSTALESITVPFDSVRGVYDQFSKDLGPLGLKLDYEYIIANRDKIADMLR